MTALNETFPPPDEGFEQKMRELRERFIQRMQSDAEAIRTLRKSMAADPLLSADIVKQLIRVVHSLAGAAGVFGFATISDAAHIAEMRLREIEDIRDDPNFLLDELERQIDLCAQKAAMQG